MRLMQTPKSLELSITNRCNLRCPYCSHFTSPAEVDHDLPTKEWLQFFEELNRCAVMNVILEGGEPFCRPDLPEIIEGLIRNRLRFSILSNGTLITEEMAAFLAATRRCDLIQISIDGATATTHEATRGSGTFPKTLQAITVLRKHHIRVSVRVTINRFNVRDLEQIAGLLLEDLGLSGFDTNSASYLGLCRTNPERIQLTI